MANQACAERSSMLLRVEYDKYENSSSTHRLQVRHVACLPGFWSLPAVQTGRVFICEHALFSRPAPRLVDGVELLARILHPTRVRTRLTPGLVLKLNVDPRQRCRPEELHSKFQEFV